MPDRTELRRAARKSAANASRQTLLQILADRGAHPVEVYTACHEELVNRYPCNNCGAPEGAACFASYGCRDESRRPRITLRDPVLGSIMLRQLVTDIDAA
jgi:hypothetical protein